MRGSYSFALTLLTLIGCARSGTVTTPPVGPPPGESPAGVGSVPEKGEEAAESKEPTADSESVRPREPEEPASRTTPDSNAKEDVEDTVDAMLAKARVAAQSGDFATAIGILDGVLQKQPTNRDGLSLMAQATQLHAIAMMKGGQESDAFPLFLKSAQVVRKLRELNSQLTPPVQRMLPIILYNEACAYCRIKEPDFDKAIASLKEAIDAGFNDLAQIDKDTDLDPIRDLPEFKRLRDQLEAKKQD